MALAQQSSQLTGLARQLVMQSFLNEEDALGALDAAKKDNATYYDLTIDQLAPGGLFLIDNVLWGGKVIHDQNDKDAIHIIKFNKMVAHDKRVECVMLPVRDGMSLIRKK